MSISAIIHTHNSAATLVKALRSVKWADEVVVIDMESSDQTLAIAKKHKARIEKFKLHHFVEPARNFGIKQAQSDWVLILDADEEISATLKERLLELSQSSTADAFYLPRQNWVFGHAMKFTGWWPDYQLRFFRQGTVNWPPEVHAQPVVKGRVEYLPAQVEWAILHHNYPTVESFIERLDRYTTIKADELAQTKSSLPLPFTSFGEEFLRRYFAQDGWRDKRHGASLALLQGMYEMVVQLKVWQARNFVDQTPAVAHVQAIEEFQRQLDFWLADWHLRNEKGWRRWWWQVRRKLRS